MPTTIDLSTATPLLPSFMASGSGSVVLPGALTVTGALTVSGVLTAQGANILDAQQFVNYVYAHKQAGANFGAKLSAAITAMTAISANGGVVDCTGLIGAQSMTADVTIPSGVKVILGAMVLTTANAFLMTTASTKGVSLVGYNGYSGDQASGTEATNIVYTGTVAPIQMGNTTNNCFGIEIGGIKIDITGAGNAASAISVLPTVGFDFHHLTIAAKTTTVAALNAQEGITLNGGTGAVGAPFVGTGVIRSTYMTGAKYGIHSLATDNSLARVNNILIDTDVSIRTNNAGGDTRQGIYIQNGNTWKLNGVDVDSPDVALHLGANASTIMGEVRPESSATWDILADAGSQDCRVGSMNQNYLTFKVSDGGARNVFYTNEWRFNGVISGGFLKGALDLNCGDATTRHSIRKGQTANQDVGTDYRNGVTAAIEYSHGVDGSGNYYVRNGAGNNVVKSDATNTFINPPTAAGITFLNFNNGTNGIRQDDGLGTGVVAFAIGGNANNPGIVNTYGKIATAGHGLAAVRGATSQKAESAADTNVLTVTTPAAGTYRLSFVMSVSAANAAVLGWTATWTDSTGTANAPTNLALFQNGAAAPALTFTTSAVGTYSGSVNIDVNGAANVVVKLTFTGTSFTAKCSAALERII